MSKPKFETVVRDYDAEARKAHYEGMTVDQLVKVLHRSSQNIVELEEQLKEEVKVKKLIEAILTRKLPA